MEKFDIKLISWMFVGSVFDVKQYPSALHNPWTRKHFIACYVRGVALIVLVWVNVLALDRCKI